MSVAVPTSVDGGLGGGGAVGAAGAGAAAASGAPDWLVWLLIGFTVLMLTWLIWRVGKRGGKRAPLTLAVVLLVGVGAVVVTRPAPETAAAVDRQAATVAQEAAARGKMAAGSEGMVGLSFDDGPSPEVTPAILRILRQQGVRATFFLQGTEVKKHPDLVRAIQRDGHVIGNHSYNHPDFSTLTYDQARQSIEWTNNLIERVTGERPTLFRYPFGNSNPETDRAVRDLGMWDVLWHWSEPGTGDFECPGWKEVERYAINQLADQAIILLHDGNDVIGCGEKQLKYLDRLIRTARQAGYDFGTIATADGPSHINQDSWVQVVAPE